MTDPQTRKRMREAGMKPEEEKNKSLTPREMESFEECPRCGERFANKRAVERHLEHCSG